MWIDLGNGRVVLVHHEAHITRLLNEGGREVADPTLAKEEEVTDGSTLNNGEPDITGQDDDQRSVRRKSAVRRPSNTGQA